MASKIGFVGLGIMGKPMAKNLLKAGHSLVVYDIIPAGMDEVAAAGADKGSSPKDVASRTDLVITMVPDGPEVEQAVLGSNGVLEGAKKGTIVVDMSSISPMVSQKVGAACEAKGVEFLDAPVSGGEPKAIDGTLAIMVGGKKDVFDKVDEELEEVHEAIGSGDESRVHDEIGDLLFTIANLARKLNVNPEEALQSTNRKFTRRFEAMEREARAEGKNLDAYSLEELDGLWERAKKVD